MEQLTIDKMIELLQAFKRGETLEFLSSRGEWLRIDNPDFLFSHSQVRVKSKPKYRPYKNAEEVLEDSKLHGPYIKCPDGNYVFPTKILKHNCLEWVKRKISFASPCNPCQSNQVTRSVSVEDNRATNVMDFEELFNNGHTWQDGAPFGKIVAE